MKTLLTWAVGLPLVFALAGIAFDNPKGTPAWVSKTMLNQVYAVSDGVQRKRTMIGTGLWIDDRHVLTNCHVMAAFATYYRDDEQLKKDYKNSFAVDHTGTKVFEMEAVACDEETDLGLLRSRWPNHDAKPIVLDWRSLRFGEAIYSAGYGLNQPLSPKYGYAGVLQALGPQLVQFVTMPITPGDSGSPVFDRWGRLRSVLNRTYMAGTVSGSVPVGSKTLSIPGWTVKTFLEEHGVYRGN